MKFFFSFFFIFFSTFIFAQDKNGANTPAPRKSLIKTAEQKAKEKAQKAPITSYKIYSINRDTTIVDTTLSIKQDYRYNYYRKDIFGLMMSSNEGQPYTVLNFSLNKFNPYPEFGANAKHNDYLQADDIKYYSVATPLSDLYFKTTMEQGQNAEALVTLNTSKRLNFSIAYRGLRSLGKYINQLSSVGNFRITTSYFTSNNLYNANFHFAGQDITNGENGGITTPSDFESGDKLYSERSRLQVFLSDAKTTLKGKRFFVDHSFRINKNDAQNNLFIAHQFNYEHKYFEFYQTNFNSYIGTSTAFQRFGDQIGTSTINDHTYYDKIYNKAGAVYENKLLGKFQFFIENFYYNYSYYNDQSITINSNTIVYPSNITATINSIGGQYEYLKNKWRGNFSFSNSISAQATRNLDAKMTYTLNEKNNFTFQYQNISKLPDNDFALKQSSYVAYNWYNSYKNEKINSLIITANTQWANASAQITNLTDHLYFKDISSGNQQYVTPAQSPNSISYFFLKVNKEIKYRNFALDNTILYQKVAQQENILNVPDFTTRNTLYYTNFAFKKALSYQAGIMVNYFTKFYANDYNPIIGDYFVQNTTKIGNFPMLDAFINGRIRQCRIFIKAEHINAFFGQKNYFSSPSMPYHDFMVRFGLVWNFFQ